MGEDNIIDFGPVTDQMKGIIKVVGVGGGGWLISYLVPATEGDYLAERVGYPKRSLTFSRMERSSGIVSARSMAMRV